jgi:hypothetical protein
MALDLALMPVQKAHDGTMVFLFILGEVALFTSPGICHESTTDLCTCAGQKPTPAGALSRVYVASSPQFQPAHCQSYANFEELCKPLPTSRPAYLDAVSGILESHFHASQNISTNPEALKKYHSVFVTVLSFVIDELNEKDIQ